MNTNKIRKIFFSLIAPALMVSAIGLTLTGCSTIADDFQPMPRPTSITPAAVSSISVRGTVKSVTSRNIYSNLGFTMQEVLVEVGDTVTAGQVLTTSETDDLLLSIAQQRAAIELTRQSNETMLSDTQRMLDDAAANLNHGINMHVINASAGLSAAAAALKAVQINYDSARHDYESGSDPHFIAAENAVRDARIAAETLESSHANLQILYDGGLLAREDLRQSANAVQAAQNFYADALTGVESVTDAQRRALEQLQVQLNSARSAHSDAQSMLNAAREAARQEVEMIRGNVELAEIATNLEHMEIALQILERQLEQSVLTAPVSGTVTAVHAREGAPGIGLMFTIEDTDNLRVVTSFREYDIGLLSPGMEVTIIPNAAGIAPHTGIISRINPAAIVGSPVVEFEVEIQVTSDNTGLRIGMNTGVKIGLERTAK